MKEKELYNKIPVALKESEFNEFVLPHLKKGSRGPSKKLSFFKIFNYILKFMHTGCQWEQIPIEKDESGKPEIHHTKIFNSKMLDTDILHGDGTCTTAKKGAII